MDKPKFLQKVKVKQFTQSIKRVRHKPNKTINDLFREITKIKNTNLDQIFTVIGVTSLKEGWTDYVDPEVGNTFRQTASVTVYIVACTLGRRYKATLDDLELVE